MKVLLVTPVKQGSGETITSMHIAEDLVSKGHTVLFLASTFARHFIEKQFPRGIALLTGNGAHNHSIWKSTLRAFSADVLSRRDRPAGIGAGMAAEPRGVACMPRDIGSFWLCSTGDGSIYGASSFGDTLSSISTPT